jgi:hypothetical protein
MSRLAFCDLPAEIRNHIYGYVQFQKSIRSSDLVLGHPQLGVQALLCSGRQVHNEFACFLYERLYFVDFEVALQFLRAHYERYGYYMKRVDIFFSAFTTNASAVEVLHLLGKIKDQYGTLSILALAMRKPNKANLIDAAEILRQESTLTAFKSIHGLDEFKIIGWRLEDDTWWEKVFRGNTQSQKLIRAWLPQTVSGITQEVTVNGTRGS